MKTLIHIGAPKTATTYLQETYYPYHPDLVYIPHVNEWNRWMWSLDNPNIKAIVTCEEGIMGQPKKRNAILANLECLIKDPVILITTRAPDPSLLFSIYSQAIRGGYRKSFSQFFSDNLDQWTKIFDYQTTYDECCSIFGSDRVILLPQELLRSDPGKFLHLLESRIGISSFEPVKTKQVNQKLTDNQIAFYRSCWPILSWFVRLRGNRELPLYAKKIYMTHSSLMNKISENLGRVFTFFVKPEKIDTSAILESFSSFVPAMENLSYYKEYLERYRNRNRNRNRN